MVATNVLGNNVIAYVTSIGIYTNPPRERLVLLGGIATQFGRGGKPCGVLAGQRHTSFVSKPKRSHLLLPSIILSGTPIAGLVFTTLARLLLLPIQYLYRSLHMYDLLQIPRLGFQ